MFDSSVGFVFGFLVLFVGVFYRVLFLFFLFSLIASSVPGLFVSCLLLYVFKSGLSSVLSVYCRGWLVLYKKYVDSATSFCLVILVSLAVWLFTSLCLCEWIYFDQSCRGN